MRIIAGEFRGRHLLPPESDTTRPITDRVKQSVFDILSPLIPGAIVYDCFAGTGSMGLECISRGAAKAVFFESDRSAIARLRQNIEILKVQSICTIIATDVFRHFAPPPLCGVPSLVFLDPPYRFLTERAEALRGLAAALGACLAPDGTIIFRHDSVDRLDLPGLRATDERTYGGMTVEFLQPQSGE